MSFILELEPKSLWKHFDDIRKIPRPSGQEEAVGDHLVSFAEKLGLSHVRDKEGNIVIRKPGSKGHEDSPGVVLQSHTDMVCEKNSDKEFDFNKEAIQLVRQGDWLKADGTTLGADNGIGVATALAILEDDSLVHGPLEALFTVDEETGLIGAMSLAPDLLQGRVMLNLDSEDLGAFSIGCAGGRDTHILLPVSKKQPQGDTLLKIHLSGLRGGHSGVDIHEGRGNALKVLNRLLYQADKIMPLEIASFEGGDKHNAIPREAIAQIVIESGKVSKLQEWFEERITEIKTEFSPVEKNISLEIARLNALPPNVLSGDSQKRLLALIFALPHGPLAMSRQIKSLVETSNNVASIRCFDNQIKVHCSSRSSNDNALVATLDKLIAIASLAAGTVEQPPGYPGWMPDLESPILKISMDTFKEVAGKEARYEAIHAGLECGLIGKKFPGMDMISIGPTIKHPHSPDECVEIKSVELFYKHVLRILEVLA